MWAADYGFIDTRPVAVTPEGNVACRSHSVQLGLLLDRQAAGVYGGDTREGPARPTILGARSKCRKGVLDGRNGRNGQNYHRI